MKLLVVELTFVFWEPLHSSYSQITIPPNVIWPLCPPQWYVYPQITVAEVQSLTVKPSEAETDTRFLLGFGQCIPVSVTYVSRIRWSHTLYGTSGLVTGHSK